MLVLSGGGDYGAFGAGFLEGWGTVPPGPVSRPPEFDIVTGVSTGALIAPFAFIGDNASYRRVTDLYQEPKTDWVRLAGLFFFLPGRASFLDTRGLQRDIYAQFDADVVARITEGYRQGRVLGIGTTNLDLSVTRPWNLTDEAVKAVETGNLDRVHKVLLASAAIPAAFPPVAIDDTLYVDGGTSSNILYNIEMLTQDSPRTIWRRKHPDRPLPRMRFWVIINNQLDAAPQLVQPNWPSITSTSVSTAIRSSTVGSLRFLALQVEFIKHTEKVDIEVYYIAIPDEWRAPKTGIFEKETMRSLAERGYELGCNPDNWKTYHFTPNAPIDPFTGSSTQSPAR